MLDPGLRDSRARDRRNVRGRGRGFDRRGRSRRCARRQKCQRIEIALLVRGRAHAEVDVRRVAIDDTARADRADNGTFDDGCTTPDVHRPEMHERRGVAGRGLDRDRLAAGRDASSEAHDTVDRRQHARPARRTHVDAAVLSGCVRMCPVE